MSLCAAGFVFSYRQAGQAADMEVWANPGVRRQAARRVSLCAAGFVFSYRKAGQAGNVTRLMSCTATELAAWKDDGVPTHVAPSWSVHPRTGDQYSCAPAPRHPAWEPAPALEAAPAVPAHTASQCSSIEGFPQLKTAHAANALLFTSTHVLELAARVTLHTAS